MLLEPFCDGSIFCFKGVKHEKKACFMGGVFLIILLLCSCSPNIENRNAVEFDIPSEFHGTWQNVATDTETGLRDIVTISREDIISGSSIAEGVNYLIESYQKEADSLGVNFSTNFSQSNPVEGRYSYTLIITIGYSSVIQNFELAINNDGHLIVTLNTVAAGQTIQDSKDEYLKVKESTGQAIIDVEYVNLNFPKVFWGDWLSEDTNPNTGEKEKFSISEKELLIDGVSVTELINSNLEELERESRLTNEPLNFEFYETIQSKYYYFRINLRTLDKSNVLTFTLDWLADDAMHVSYGDTYSLHTDIYYKE